MKACNKCNMSYSDKHNYCTVCGSELKEEIDTSNIRFSTEKSIFMEKIEADPLNADLLYDYVSFLLQNNLFSEALKYAFKVHLLRKNDRTIQKTVIFCFKKVGDHKKAYEFVSELFETDKSNTEIAFELGYLCRNLGYHKRAIEIYEHIINSNPSGKEKPKAFALLLTETNKYISAAQHWKEVYAYDNEDVHARIFHTISSFDNGNIEIAKDELETLLSQFGKGDYYRIIILIYLFAIYLSFDHKQKEFTEKACFEEIIESNKIDSLFYEAKELLGKSLILLAKKYLANSDYINAKYIQDLLISWSFSNLASRVNSLIYLSTANHYLKNKEVYKAYKINKQGLRHSVQGSKEEVELQVQRSTINRKIKTYVLIVLIPVVIIFGVIATNKAVNSLSERSVWKKAQNENSLVSYQNYLDSYPTGRYHDRASDALIALKSEDDNYDLVSREVNEDEELERVFDQFAKLYEDLLNIKGQDNFRTYGFGSGGPYYYWLQNLENLEKDEYAKLLTRKSIAVGDLRTVAFEYANNHGGETQLTKDLNTMIMAAIKPQEEKEPDMAEKGVSGERSIGKWSLESTVSRSLNHEVEILFDGSKYYSIMTFNSGNRKEYSLRNEGNRYYITGNNPLSRSGEYYLVSSDGNMSLHDKIGKLDMFIVRKK